MSRDAPLVLDSSDDSIIFDGLFPRKATVDEEVRSENGSSNGSSVESAQAFTPSRGTAERSARSFMARKSVVSRSQTCQNEQARRTENPADRRSLAAQSQRPTSSHSQKPTSSHSQRATCSQSQTPTSSHSQRPMNSQSQGPISSLSALAERPQRKEPRPRMVPDPDAEEPSTSSTLPMRTPPSQKQSKQSAAIPDEDKRRSDHIKEVKRLKGRSRLRHSEKVENDPLMEEKKKKMGEAFNTGVVGMIHVFGSAKKKPSKALHEEILERYKQFYAPIREACEAILQKELRGSYAEAVSAASAHTDNVHLANLRAQGITPPPVRWRALSPERHNEKSYTTTWDHPTHDKDGNLMRKVRGPRSVKVYIDERTPDVNYYVPIEESICGEDVLRLSHMPYFSDGQSDFNLCANLFAAFPEGIHGFGADFGYCDNWILYRMLRKCLEDFKKGRSGENPDIIYYTIYRMFPNQKTQSELSNLFPELCLQFAEPDFDPRSLEPWRPVKKLEIAKNLRDTNCYACLTYMCSIHGFRGEVPAEFTDGEFIDVTFPIPPGPEDKQYCENQPCWKSTSMKMVSKLLKPTNEELKEKRVKAHFSKHRLVEEDSTNMATFFSCRGGGVHNICDYVKGFLVEKSSCRDAFIQLMKFAEYPDADQLQLGRQNRKISYNERKNNFIREHERRRRERNKNGANDETRAKLVWKTKVKPCNHAGPCRDATSGCSCYENGYCWYGCKCNVNCPQRLYGCKCAPGKCSTNLCQCWLAEWECNPETCTTCGCGDMDTEKISCLNASMTRMIQKKLKPGKSRIKGLGLFLCEPARKGEFVVEYVGERISDEEAERRGTIYDLNNLSYMFAFPFGGNIDSYRVGNLSRFANHDAINPSLFARNVCVAGEARIGMYATRDLEDGEELTFDYNYSAAHQVVFMEQETATGKSLQRFKKESSVKASTKRIQKSSPVD